MKIEKLYPAFKDYIWGGEKLKTKYGKVTDLYPVAESWELSFHKDGLTSLVNGATLAETADALALGKRVREKATFPMLIKLIDARNDLSVQVHPSDEYALKNEGSLGKTEMWYIVHADEGAGIYLGFKDNTSRDAVERSIREKSLTDLMNFYEVRSGECYFIPAGTIHAIGGGCLILEIQQNSNVTYRVYDYGRKDRNGNERELHISKALDVLDYGKFKHATFDGVLGECEYFRAREIIVDGVLTFETDSESFHCITVVSGEGRVGGVKLNTLESVFVPADHEEYKAEGNMKIIITDIGEAKI